MKPPTLISAAEFFAALNQHCEGVVELRILPSKYQKYFYKDQSIESSLTQYSKENIYFGVATRRDSRNGTLENCQDLGALFVDLDFKTQSEEEARRILREFSFSPSLVIQSGGGLHVYWLLNEPLHIQDPQDCQKAKSYLRRLAIHLHGDLAAAEPARILRVPGTTNFKYTPPRPVAIEVFEPSRIYDLTDFDEWLSEESSSNNARTHSAYSTNGNGKIAEGHRNSFLYRTGRSDQAKGFSESEIFSALKTLNLKRCDPPLDDEEVQRIVRHVSTQPDRPDFYPPCTTPDASLHLTDYGNAERLIQRNGHSLKFCHQWKTWLVWDEKRWLRDDTQSILHLAKETVRQILAEASQESNEENRKRIVKHAFASESNTRLHAMVTLAESEQPLAVTPGQLDADPWLLNCANGTLDLRTGHLLPHDRGHLNTKYISINYDPSASAPLWETFLYRIMNEREDLIRFLQRAIGYGLTGETMEQVLFLLYGTGANGKSVLLETLRGIWGDYAQHAEFSAFLAKKHDPIRNDIARLVGARLATATEVEEGRHLSEALIKQVTGGDMITARFLFQEYFEFRPMFKLFLATNHKPMIKGTDHGIWRRIRLVPFAVTIPEAERDQHLITKLKQEYPGILAWAVRGCLEWQQQGLGLSPEVKEATQEYRLEMDTLGRFLEEFCVLSPSATVKSVDLYKAYIQWCNGNGETALKQNTLGLRLLERGLHRERTNKFRGWKGLGLIKHGD